MRAEACGQPAAEERTRSTKPTPTPPVTKKPTATPAGIRSTRRKSPALRVVPMLNMITMRIGLNNRVYLKSPVPTNHVGKTNPATTAVETQMVKDQQRIAGLERLDNARHTHATLKHGPAQADFPASAAPAARRTSNAVRTKNHLLRFWRR